MIRGNGNCLQFFFLGNHDATALFSGSLKPEDVATLEIEDPYTKELVEAWCRLNFRGTTLPYALAGSPFFYKSWFVADVTKVSNHLYETSSRFLTFEAFEEKYTIKANFLQYHSVVAAVLNAKKNFVLKVHPTPKFFFR